MSPVPQEALILERQLIREHKPQYNSLLKDDKSYPFIAISTHEFPRILYTRHPPKDAKRWGPFPDAKAAKMVIKLLRRYFGIRDERDKLPFGYVESEEYSKRVKAVVSILDGDANLLIKNLQKEMDRHSEKFRYEAAARSRDMIAAVQQTLAQQIIHSRFYQSVMPLDLPIKVISERWFYSTENGSVVGQVQYPLMHREAIFLNRFLEYSRNTMHNENHRRPFLSLHRWENGWSLG